MTVFSEIGTIYGNAGLRQLLSDSDVFAAVTVSMILSVIHSITYDVPRQSNQLNQEIYPQQITAYINIAFDIFSSFEFGEIPLNLCMMLCLLHILATNLTLINRLFSRL